MEDPLEETENPEPDVATLEDPPAPGLASPVPSANPSSEFTEFVNADLESNIASTQTPTLLPSFYQYVGMNRTISTATDSDKFAEVSMYSFAGAFLGALDEFREDIDNDGMLNQVMIGSTLAISSSLSVGYVIWLIRGGVLLSSVLSSLPAWQMIDPLPILGSLDDDEEETDDESLESLVTKSNNDRLSTVQS